MKHDVSAAVGFFALVNLERRRTVARPLHGLCALAVAERHDVHAVGHHKCRVEAQTKVADDGRSVVLVFLQEVVCAREGYLVDVFVDLLRRHADAPVADGERLRLLVGRDAHGEVAELALEVALHRERFQLLRGVDCVAHNLAQENLVVAVKKLLDNRENVLGSYSNIALLHNIIRCMLFCLFSTSYVTNSVPMSARVTLAEFCGLCVGGRGNALVCGDYKILGPFNCVGLVRQ